LKRKNSFSKWNKSKSIPGGIGASPDPISPLASPPGINVSKQIEKIFILFILYNAKRKEKFF
jgi:hypothetical protein